MIRGRYGFGGTPVTSRRWGINKILAIVPSTRRVAILKDYRLFSVGRDQ